VQRPKEHSPSLVLQQSLLPLQLSPSRLHVLPLLPPLLLLLLLLPPLLLLLLLPPNKHS
jgi:hypothetical protein